MKLMMMTVAIFAHALTAVCAQDHNKAAQMSYVTIDCAMFTKIGSNWITRNDTTVASSKSEGVHPLNKGTLVTGTLTYGIYLEDVLEARCPRK